MKALVLDDLQRALEIIYGVTAPSRVEDFVVRREALERMGTRVHSEEQLFVLEEQGTLEVGLYIDPALLDRLPALGEGGGQGFLDRFLPAFSTAAEGVSHFVYLTLQAVRDRAVSLLELEVQAEVDKFATSLLHLWKHGERRLSGELRARLFDRVGYRPNLNGDEQDRYRTANRLARGYAADLERRFVAGGHLEGLLRDLRQVYRIRAVSKLELLASRA